MTEFAAQDLPANGLAQFLIAYGEASAHVRRELLRRWDLESMTPDAASQLVADHGLDSLLATVARVMAVHESASAAIGTPIAIPADKRHWLHPYFPHDSGTKQSLA